MTAPLAFDPAGYVADMSAAGAELVPHTIATRRGTGRRVFSIAIPAGRAGAMLAVAAKWEASAVRHPDWMDAVHDVLVASVAASASGGSGACCGIQLPGVATAPEASTRRRQRP